MNAEEESLLRRLEQATSRKPVDLSQLDEETVTLRENWLALERVLRGADQSANLPTVTLPTARKVRRRSPIWVLASLGALAAAVLIWVSLPGERPSEVAGRAGDPDKKVPWPSPGPIRTPDSSSLEPRPLPVRDDSPALAWEDGWDQEFNQTTVALQQLRVRRESADSNLSRLENRFAELAFEFDSSSL